MIIKRSKVSANAFLALVDFIQSQRNFLRLVDIGPPIHETHTVKLLTGEKHRDYVNKSSTSLEIVSLLHGDWQTSEGNFEVVIEIADAVQLTSPDSAVKKTLRIPQRFLIEIDNILNGPAPS